MKRIRSFFSGGIRFKIFSMLLITIVLIIAAYTAVFFYQTNKVEKLVNEAIEADVPVVCEEMTVPEAKEKGAIGLFESKYGDRVRTYKMGDFSFEICGGPHAEHTGELGHFKIQKEESSSAGVRRIKATVTGPQA